MKVIDLTHTINENISVFPGTEAPRLTEANTHGRDGFKETLISMYSHSGTHIDPPFHIFENGKTLDSYEADAFVGRALVIDCREVNLDGQIPLSLIKKHEKVAGSVDFLLFCTGFDKKWGTDKYCEGYPVLSLDALEYIIEKGYKGIGLDTIGLDPIDSLERHRLLFSNSNTINIENLKNLDLCIGKTFTFVCLPLKIENSDGASARAIAIMDIENG